MLKVTVITINYNNAKGLELSIKSVCEQLFPLIEFIVIDGGSIDGSKNVIEKFQERISYAVSEPDEGIYHAMNKGILEANGDYLLFLNSGDVFANSNSLQQLCDNSIEDIVYGNVLLKQKDGRLVPFRFQAELNILDLYVKPLCHQATLIKRSLFSKVGLYNQNASFSSDWQHSMLSIFKYNATYRFVNEFLVVYDHNGVSSSGEFEKVIWKEKKDFMIENFPVLMKGNAVGNYLQMLNLLLSLKNHPFVRFLMTLGFLRSVKNFNK